MDMEQVFLDDIIKTPDEDAPRLIYADWLEEHDQSKRADFIRLQVKLARMAEDEPNRPKLARYEWELLSIHARDWLGAPPAVVTPAPHTGASWPPWDRHRERRILPGWVTDYEFRRGFAEWISLPTVLFLELSESFWRLVPLLRSVKLHKADECLPGLAASPHLARLTSLDLSFNWIGSTGAEALAASSHLTSHR
jgi:uncharacterized protein (TIGR02996 family)